MASLGYPCPDAGQGQFHVRQGQEDDAHAVTCRLPPGNQARIAESTKRCLERETPPRLRTGLDLRQHDSTGLKRDRIGSVRGQAASDQVRVDEIRTIRLAEQEVFR